MSLSLIKIDNLFGCSGTVVDRDVDLCYDSLDLRFMVSPTSFSTDHAYGIALVLRSRSFGLRVVSTATPVFHGLSILPYRNILYTAFSLLGCTLSYFLTARLYVLPPDRHANIQGEVSTRALWIVCYSEPQSRGSGSSI
jgi:hypothetical protein